MPFRRAHSHPNLHTTAHPHTSESLLSAILHSADDEPPTTFDVITLPEKYNLSGGSPFSELVRWVENPLRLPALPLFYLTANAGLPDGTLNGRHVHAELSRIGERHNLVRAELLAPSVAYVKQLVSRREMDAADRASAAARGVEWFMLEQAAMGYTPAHPAMNRFAFVSQSGFGDIPAAAVSFYFTCDRCSMFFDGDLLLADRDVVKTRWGPGRRVMQTFPLPMFHVTDPLSIMQLLQERSSYVDVDSPMIRLSARMQVPDYKAALHRAVREGLSVSLLRLHVEDVGTLVENELALGVDPNDVRWFGGLDIALLPRVRDTIDHFIAGEVDMSDLVHDIINEQSVWIDDYERMLAGSSLDHLPEMQDLLQKLRVCVRATFSRTVARLKRGDTRQNLSKAIRAFDRPKVELFALNTLEVAAKHQEENGGLENVRDRIEDAAVLVRAIASVQEGVAKEEGLDGGRDSVPLQAGGASEPASDVPLEEDEQVKSAGSSTEPTMLPAPLELVPAESLPADRHLTSSGHAGGGYYRAEPRSRYSKPDDLFVELTDGHPIHERIEIVSNRAEKIVWRVTQEKVAPESSLLHPFQQRADDYWGSLYNWLLLARQEYSIERDSTTGCMVWKANFGSRKVTKITDYPMLVKSMGTNMLEEYVTTIRSMRILPGSWSDPSVRVDLILLSYAATSCLELPDLSSCAALLVSTLKDVLYNTTVENSESSKLGGAERFSMPSEIRCFGRPHRGDREEGEGVFLIQWRPRVFLGFRGIWDRKRLHAILTEDCIVYHEDAAELTEMGFERLPPLVRLFGENSPILLVDVNRMGPPQPKRRHLERGAVTSQDCLRLFKQSTGLDPMLAWTTSSGVHGAIYLRGKLSLLREVASWVPGVKVMGSGYSPPPKLSQDSMTAYFKSGRHAVLVWTQAQWREVLVRKKESLFRTMGSVPADPRSTFLAHATADFALLQLIYRDGLRCQAGDACWLGNGIRVNDNGFTVSQQVLVPVGAAVMVDGRQASFALDDENRLLLDGVAVERGTGEHDGSYVVQAESAKYVRIGTGNMDDCAYRRCAVRAVLGHTATGNPATDGASSSGGT